MIALTLDLDDITVNNGWMQEKLLSYPRVISYFGMSSSKVSACNRNVPKVLWDVMMLTSDDMVFVKKDFGVKILEDFERFFPNYDGFIHYPTDKKTWDILCTLPVMGIKFYEEHGYIYHPRFQSVYCDTFQTHMAKKIKKYKFIDFQLAEHRHPRWTKEAKDELYTRNEDKELYQLDLNTYNELMVALG